jgi:hypothetical protein
VDQVFETLSECQALNPDEEEDFSGLFFHIYFQPTVSVNNYRFV